MLSGVPNISEVTRFVLQIIYNRPLKEKSPGESRYNMLTSKKQSNKKYPTSKALPPDQSSLKVDILRATFVAHCMSGCLNRQYAPLDPSNYGWKLEENRWQPIWFEGNPLPKPDEIIDTNIQLDDKLGEESSNISDREEAMEKIVIEKIVMTANTLNLVMTLSLKSIFYFHKYTCAC